METGDPKKQKAQQVKQEVIENSPELQDALHGLNTAQKRKDDVLANKIDQVWKPIERSDKEIAEAYKRAPEPISPDEQEVELRNKESIAFLLKAKYGYKNDAVVLSLAEKAMRYPEFKNKIISHKSLVQLQAEEDVARYELNESMKKAQSGFNASLAASGEATEDFRLQDEQIVTARQKYDKAKSLKSAYEDAIRRDPAFVEKQKFDLMRSLIDVDMKYRQSIANNAIRKIGGPDKAIEVTEANSQYNYLLQEQQKAESLLQDPNYPAEKKPKLEKYLNEQLPVLIKQKEDQLRKFGNVSEEVKKLENASKTAIESYQTIKEVLNESPETLKSNKEIALRLMDRAKTIVTTGSVGNLVMADLGKSFGLSFAGTIVDMGEFFTGKTSVGDFIKREIGVNEQITEKEWDGSKWMVDIASAAGASAPYLILGGIGGGARAATAKMLTARFATNIGGKIAKAGVNYLTNTLLSPATYGTLAGVYTNSFDQEFSNLILAGKSPEESYNIASKKATADAVVNVLSEGIFDEASVIFKGSGVNQWIAKTGFGQFLQESNVLDAMSKGKYGMAQELGKRVFNSWASETLEEVVAMGGESYNKHMVNILAQQEIYKDILPTMHEVGVMLGSVLLTTGAMTMANRGKSIDIELAEMSKSGYDKAVRGFKTLVDTGVYSEEEVKPYMDKLQRYSNLSMAMARNALPEDIVKYDNLLNQQEELKKNMSNPSISLGEKNRLQFEINSIEAQKNELFQQAVVNSVEKEISDKIEAKNKSFIENNKKQVEKIKAESNQKGATKEEQAALNYLESTTNNVSEEAKKTDFFHLLLLM